MLNVMAGRLARIVDRGRALAERRHRLPASEQEILDLEQRYLERRRHSRSVAITACTIAQRNRIALREAE